jgi:predicted glycosyltransferase
MRVFFYVQHLLGVGHLKRAATLARGLEAAGFEVTLASGGLPTEGIGFPVLQLPPAKSDAAFKHLLDERGEPVDDAWKARRRDALLKAWLRSGADVLMIELFPFGRRQMRFELLPLLDEARSSRHGRRRRPLIVCSARDLIQWRPTREPEMLEYFERYFDRLLVHGDPAIASFNFGLAARLAGRLHYTGYVVNHVSEKTDLGSDEVLVSAGGGAVGRPLLEAALVARPLTSLRDRPWRLLAGINALEADLASLRKRAGPGVIVERSRQDFTARLASCVLSVSQAGYNTVMEILAARARALVVPFAGGGEVEQTTRAHLLVARGLLEMIEEGALDGASLAAAIERALARPRPAPGQIDLDGAAASARLLRQWL